MEQRIENIEGISWDSAGFPFSAVDNYQGCKTIMSEWIKNDPSGQQFAQEFNTAASVEKLGQQLAFHSLTVSSRNLSWVFERLRDSGQLTTPTQETATTHQEPDVPRDRNGKPLTAAQIRWSEYGIFSETHSMQQVRDRVRTDKAFAAFVQTNREREFEGVGDGVVATDGALHNLTSVRARSGNR